MKKPVVIALIFASACTATKSIAPSRDLLSSMQQKVPGIILERAEQGFVLYKNKCAGCHRLHSPSEKDSNKWEMILREMYPKAKITDADEKKLIRDYLVALSK